MKDAGCNQFYGYCCCNDYEYYEACTKREPVPVPTLQATTARPVGGQYQGYPYEVTTVSD